MTATFLYLMLALKIPIIGLLYLVYWAIKQEPEPTPGPGGGSPVPERPRPHRRPPRSPRPRRDPHGSASPPAPARVRSVTARGRDLTHR